MMDRATRRIAVRPATPDDASAFADLAIMAGGGFFELFMGPRARPCLEAMFREPANYMSWEKGHFAVIAGRIAGMVHGLAWSQSRAERERTYTLYGRRLGLRCLHMVLLSFLMPSWVIRPAKGQYYIAFLAVYPEFRGRGVGARLLEHAADIASGISCDALSLDVDGHNAPAIRLYEKCGFVITKAGQFPPIVELGQVLRMEKCLVEGASSLMSQVRPDQKRTIRRFVRDVLGCGCPEEVFWDIRMERAEPPLARKIVVGGRLLIYIIPADDPTRLASSLPALVAAGRAERDVRRLNRVRIVLAARDTSQVESEARRVFSGLDGVDDRTHIHVVSTSAISGL
ncbi:MAG: GNAT family N-acetyltransferase [Planctomycetota bacterium]